MCLLLLSKQHFHFHSAKAFSLCHSALLVGRLGVHQQLGGDTAGRAELRDIPYCMALCSAIKARERKKGETSGFMAFVFPSNCHTWHSPAFLEMDEQLPTDQTEQTNSLFCFACADSFWLHPPLPQPTSLLTSTLLILCPSNWEEWVSGCMGLSCLQGLAENNYLHFKYSGVKESLSSRWEDNIL